jgi:YfiH family protein
VIRFTDFESLGLKAAAFSERGDGDCSLKGAADPATAIAARQAVAGPCGASAGDIVCVKQGHGVDVAVAREEDRGRGARDWNDALGPADSILTNVPGLPLAILVADCVPLYLVDPARRAGGLVHAGWRGTFDGAAARAVEAMSREWGSDPADLYAWMGPSAGPCCYEVSPELAERFRTAGLVAEGRHVDLWGSNARRLQQAGLGPARISACGICTICDPRFHSHRRDADGCRNMALFML